MGIRLCRIGSSVVPSQITLSEEQQQELIVQGELVISGGGMTYDVLICAPEKMELIARAVEAYQYSQEVESFAAIMRDRFPQEFIPHDGEDSYVTGEAYNYE